MTLSGANTLRETNDYIIYTMNSVATGQYGVVVPKNVSGTLNMLVDLHMKSSFDLVNSGSKTVDELVNEIGEEYIKLRVKYSNGMLVIPMLDNVYFQNIVNTGDKQKMFDEVKKIGAITSELYKKLTESGVNRQSIDQKIIIVEKDSFDERFVTWLKEQNNMNNFVDGVKYNEIGISEVNANPFVNTGNNLFGPQVDNSANNNLFASNVTSTQSVVSEPIQNVTPVGQDSSVNMNNTQVISTPLEQVVPNNNAGGVVNNVGNVVNPIPVNEMSSMNNVNTAMGANVVNQAQVVEGPRPVQGATLDGTITFNPVSEQQVNVEGVSGESTSSDLTKKSNGFVNLLILAVVLVGVTIVSIELGKYLYSVYGA